MFIQTPIHLGQQRFSCSCVSALHRFRMQLDEKDQPQAASITNDRIELAESQGRLPELATEVRSPCRGRWE